MNWTKGAKSTIWRKGLKYCGYYIACGNARIVGRLIALFAEKLVNHRGVDPKNIHLIGHSLGAQASGVAGKFFKARTKLRGEEKKFGRITGNMRSVGRCHLFLI